MAQAVAGFSTQSSGLDIKRVRMEFMVDKVALG